MHNRVLQSFFVLFLVISCQKPSPDVISVKPELAQQDMKNVTYGTNASQAMDIYLPAGRDSINTKTIVFIHGGSWNAGDKSDFDSAIAIVRKSLTGFAFFNMNYRLATGSSSRFPAQADDIQSALNFIATNAKDYKVNSSKIILIGASAGAHLALLHAYKNNSSGTIKAVVDLFGPTDLNDLYSNHPVPAASQPVLVNFLGATPTTNPGLYQQASPINFVTAQSVPTLIFHGGADYIVPISQSTALKTRLQAANVKVEMTTYPTEGHGWYGANILDTYAKTIAFIQQNVK